MTHQALIDLGADCNVLSYDAWEALGKPQLTNVKMNFQSFSGEETKSLGKCCIKMSIQDQSMHITFYIANKHQSLVDIVLGRSWIASTNCGLNWATRQYTLQINSTNLTGPSTTPQPAFKINEN